MKIAYTIDEKDKKIELSPSADGYEVVWSNWTTVKPMFDYVIVEKDEEVKTTKGGLVIPDNAKEKPSTGVVVAIGEGALTDEGNVSKMYVKVGDRVIFPKLAGQILKMNNEEHTLLKQTEILGIIE